MAASWAPLKSAEPGTRLHSQKDLGLGHTAERGSQLLSSPRYFLVVSFNKPWLGLPGVPQTIAAVLCHSRDVHSPPHTQKPPTLHAPGNPAPSYLRRADPGSRCRVLQPQRQGGRRKGETGPCRSTRQRGPGSEFSEPLSPGAQIGLARPETLFLYYEV